VKSTADYGGIAVEPVAGSGVASGMTRLMQRLEEASDRLNPIVVKEVRQIVRGREFNYSFMVSLIAGLLVAFFGAASASGGTGTYGQSVFGALTGCLALVGLVVVPIGAFSALRNERLEQTIDLITVTALSPRQVIVGKLLAQAVKLGTIFAGMAPFVAMSFLLGGVDFGTIVASLAAVFLGSLWVCAAALLLSTLAKGRGFSGVLLAGGAFFLLMFLGGFRILQFLVISLAGTGGGIGSVSFFVGPGTSGAGWWALAVAATLGLATLVNLVLLAENRLSSPVDDKATALRVGFLAQFVTIIVAFWAVAYFGPPTPANVAEPIAVLCSLHLAVVAAFVVTEDFPLSRRVRLRMRAASRFWRPLDLMLRPGGARGAVYVLMQMVALVAVIAWLSSSDVSWVVAACAYIVFFTGVPTALLRRLRPGISAFQLRVAILVLGSASLVLPDVLYYLIARPETFSLSYGARHLLNPFRTLLNWPVVESRDWTFVPQILGSVGLLAYITLIDLSSRTRRDPPPSSPAAPAAGD
jgi:hypothetical protein